MSTNENIRIINKHNKCGLDNQDNSYPIPSRTQSGMLIKLDD